ncbi:hypothetical protein M1771_08020 [Spiroplasma citri]|uniref:Uncharacterized protein n=1 Tax=Spiroplasma citri TaxID=2133 RepID=A0AAX3SXI7_SPICI|nr:hypothetical protein [Spiroplasma citri]WFG96043.1 hypothetical protein M0C40_08060 [Spiroplasma citri]WFG99931.1 hypothetical protein M1771_08020 [Spiroplasma citri]
MAPQTIFEPESEHFMDEFNYTKMMIMKKTKKVVFLKILIETTTILELFEEIKKN